MEMLIITLKFCSFVQYRNGLSTLWEIINNSVSNMLILFADSDEIILNDIIIVRVVQSLGVKVALYVLSKLK